MDLVDALARARHVAREWIAAPAEFSSAISSLCQATSPARRVQVAHGLQDESRAVLDTTPSPAAALARVAYALAQTQDDADVTASAALTLAIALNRLGEFRDALACAESAASASAGKSNARANGEIAWAHYFIGSLEQAQTHIALARANTAPLIAARCDWIAGLVARDQTDYPRALALLERAGEAFRAGDESLDAARCEYDLAIALALSEKTTQATERLTAVRQTFERAGCRLDAARCDYTLAAYSLDNGSARASVAALQQTRHVFADLGAPFFIACCDGDLGVGYRFLEQWDRSLEALERARDYFRRQNIPRHISAVAINLGNTYYNLNRYEDALALYQEAADLALNQGRAGRAARVWNNMAMVHTKLGRYDQALDLYHRALQIIAGKQLDLLAAGIHSTLAECYLALDQIEEALRHLQIARQIFRALQSPVGDMTSSLRLAEVHLVCGQFQAAAESAQHAREIAVREKHEGSVALADWLLAQTVTRKTERPRAFKRLASARAIFAEQSRRVDAARCDLTEGELGLAWDSPRRAEEFFQRALAVFAPALPDYVWCAEYGLARCAMARAARVDAAAHLSNAVRAIADIRAWSGGEQFSNALFARRHAVYDDALALAVEQGVAETALDIIEASKARTFLAHLPQRGWHIPRAASDPYVADLVARERNLRDALARTRARLTLQPNNVGETLRGQAAAIAESEKWVTLGREYEHVVTQLRLAAPGLAGVSAPAPFALAEFRAAMTQTYGDDWCALDYAVRESQLVVICVTPRAVQMYVRRMTGLDARALERCASPEPDMRELIYRGTLRGVPVPQQGKRELQALYRLLLPPDLRAHTLIVAPHGALHTLPFHALLDGETYLAEQCAVVYTPSFQAAQLLGQAQTPRASNALVFGLGEFGAVMPPLPNAEREASAVRAMWQAGELRTGKNAARAEIFRLNTTGELRQFTLIHLATHALLDRAAPHQSRVLLADEPLTVFDVLGLSLEARLVTLSACQTALGKGGAGDEWIGLTRAFFYAGARALLATLWHVQDDSTGAMVTRVYTQLGRGEKLARAVQLAQIEMIRAGNPPYQWAAFALMGHG